MLNTLQQAGTGIGWYYCYDFVLQQPGKQSSLLGCIGAATADDAIRHLIHRALLPSPCGPQCMGEADGCLLL